MEGRAIARQTCNRGGILSAMERTFNGGPSNCPAKPSDWPSGAHDFPLPSMEGRAIARPNLAIVGTVTVRVSILQWRAEQLPGQTQMAGRAMRYDKALQWRAEQLPGQTCSGSCRSVCVGDPFNGGPSNCPAKPGRSSRSPRCQSTFNGGPSNCPAKLKLC